MNYKHTLVLQYMVEHGGNWYQSLRKAGYSEAVCKNPSKVRDSKSFQRLLHKSGISSEYLASHLIEGIEHAKSDSVRLKYVGMGLKLVEK